MPQKAKKEKLSLARRVHLRVPASTANLGPGFDCLGLALSLYNVFVLEPGETVSVTVRNKGCDGDDCQLLANDHKNLVWRSACEVFQREGVKLPGMRIRMDISVPLARGLGSSATAIIAGVAGANALLDNPMSEDDTFQLIVALEGHPDNVAASYYGGLTAATMHKRRAHVARFPVAPVVRAVVAIPPYPLSTEKARAALPKEVPHGDAVHNLSRIPFVIRALSNGTIDDLTWAMDDRLHEPYRLALSQDGRAIQKAAVAAGAAAVTISGAGPTLIAFCLEPRAASVADAMRRTMKGGRVEILEAEKRGVRLVVKR